ncbi:MAG: Gfo/Idh/MocA family oxidoreductase [Nitrospiraceae bacterium]|nr:Gfo/Idh/MocA family oxidoreductase [Nitrospiraceae bacterium]
MTSGRINIGVLGCSDIARRRFLPALVRAGNAHLAAIASRSRSRVQGFLAGVPYDALEYDELLAAGNVDLVYISVPNHLHEAWVIRALERGKHVICEKPLGLTVASVERMIAAARKNKRLLRENLAYLHHPAHAAVKEIVHNGAIGAVRAVRAAFRFTFSGGGFRAEPAQGGGSFHDQARYPMSAALFHLRGFPERFAGCADMRGDLNVGLQACGITTVHEGIFCSIGFEHPYECWYELLGSEGTIRIDRAFTTPADQPVRVRIARGRETLDLTIPPADHFQLMIEHTAGLLLQGSPFDDLLDDAARLAQAADLLWRDSVPVHLEN